MANDGGHVSQSAERETWVGALAELAEKQTPGPRTALLLRTDQRGAGELIELPHATSSLGRSWESGARVDDEGVSRLHAEVTVDRGSYFITDLGSSNGTYVNEQRVTSAALHDGCLVRLGTGVTFRFSVVEQDEREALRCLRQRSHYDPLTQIYNRRYLTQHLESEMAFAERHKTPLSLVLLDIDHFKGVNDAYGHLMGDEVIRRVAAIAAEQIRTEDMVARYGGEEFLVVLRQTSVAGAVALAERIRCAVQKEGFSVEGGDELRITVSAGCASLECLSLSSAHSVIGLADKRLYEAKSLGRNRVVACGKARPLSAPVVPDDSVRASRVGLTARAYEGLPNQERVILGLYYQENCSLEEIAAILKQSLAAVTWSFNEGVSTIRERVAISRGA